MAEVTINYKDTAIATMDASGTKTLQTQGKYCEDDISITYVKPGGGGTISTALDAIEAYLESNGFVISEFAVQTPESGEYLSVPHSLGRVPVLVFAFSKDLCTEPANKGTGYMFGCASAGNYGADNNNNRTYQCYGYNVGTSLLYTDCLKLFPLSVVATQYNFCQTASSTQVVMRNGNNGNTKMFGTTWILAVK